MPSLSELFGESGFLLGNPALVPEVGENLDIGVSWASTWMTASVTAFGSLAANLIQYEQNSFGQQRPFNIGAARILGVEATLEANPASWATLRGQGTFTDARDVSDTALGALSPQLPLRPPHRGLRACRGALRGAWWLRRLHGRSGECVGPSQSRDAAAAPDAGPRSVRGVAGAFYQFYGAEYQQ